MIDFGLIWSIKLLTKPPFMNIYSIAHGKTTISLNELKRLKGDTLLVHDDQHGQTGPIETYVAWTLKKWKNTRHKYECGIRTEFFSFSTGSRQSPGTDISVARVIRTTYSREGNEWGIKSDESSRRRVIEWSYFILDLIKIN